MFRKLTPHWKLVTTTAGIVVSGAGTSAVNGVYTLYSTSSTTKLWLNATKTYGIQLSYSGSSGTCYLGSVYNSGSSYSLMMPAYSGTTVTSLNTSPGSLTWTVYYGGSSPAPTVSEQAGGTYHTVEATEGVDGYGRPYLNVLASKAGEEMS